MQGTQVYEYAFVRVLPRVERGEFINVGVILFSKRKRFLDMKYHIDVDRLKALSKEVDVEEVHSYLQAWDLICQGDQKGGKIAQLEQAERFRWLTATKSTIVQCSKVHPGRCEFPERVLEKLFERYVG
ncbi:MAG: DUF3037 domain-containing protein [Bacteroidota bacterium]